MDEISSLEACGDVVSRRGSLEAFELLFARIIPFDRRHGDRGCAGFGLSGGGSDLDVQGK